jgi:PAS domain S-box-containing protein
LVINKNDPGSPLNNPFSGETEMAAVIRSMNWDNSNLGDYLSWPASLRIALNIIFNTPTPICLLWGDQLNLFWNDACESIEQLRPLFSKPGESMSEKLKIYSAVLDPIIKEVRNGKSVRYNDIILPAGLNAGNNQTKFNFSTSPITDDKNEVGGILITLSSNSFYAPADHSFTNVKYGDRLFRQLVMQSPAAMCILKGKNYVVEMANPSYLRVIDRSESEFVGIPLFESFPELVDQGIQRILDEVMDTGKPFYGYEYPVQFENRPVNQFHFNFTYQPFEEPGSGKITGVIVVAHDVSQQVKSKQRLQESEKQFRNLVLQMPVPMAILRGRELVIEMANHSILENIWRKDFEEVKHRKLLEVFPDFHGQQLPSLLQKVFDTGSSFRQNEVAQTVKTTEGVKTQYLDMVFAPLSEMGQKVSGIIITVNDVTEKVQARRMIEEAELRTRLAIEAADMGTFDWNLVTQQFNNSPRLIELFGYKAGENITHKTLIDSFHPADKPVRDKAVKESLRKGSLEYEARVIKPGNEICWLKVYGKIVYNDLGRPLRMHGTVKDITREKTTLLALEESENRLNIAISNAALGTYEVDIKTSKVSCSQRLYEIFGMPEGSLVERKDVLSLFYPADIEARNDAHAKSFSTGKVVYESRIIWPDNSIHWIRVNSRVISDENNEPYRILGTVMDITEQKNYIHQLEESERRFKTVADSAPVMIWMSGIDRLCYFFNKAWLQFTGRAPEEEYGNGWVEGVHPDDFRRCMEIYLEAFDKQEEFYMEYRLKMHTGVYHWISNNGVPRFDSKGAFLGFIGASMDIDEQKRRNEQLTKSEARLRIAALSGELGTWDYDPLTNELYWDDASAEIFGVEYHPGAVDLFWSLVYPEDIEPTSQKLWNAIDPELAGNFDVEFRFRVPTTGKLIWINAKGKAFFKDGIAYRFAGTALDITEKKLALEALQESELLFKTISNTSPVGLWLTNSNGENTFVNNTWIDWTGISLEEQKNHGWMQILAPGHREEVQNIFYKAMQLKEKFTSELRFLNKKNEWRYCLTEGFPYYNNDGSFAGYAGSVTDITQQRKTIDELKKSEESFRLLANAMPQFVWTADAKGRLNYFNESVYNYSLVDPKELEGDGWLRIVHPDDQEANIERWSLSIETGTDFFFEHRFRRNDGSYRWQLSRALPQKAEDGTIQMWIGTSTDIHDQKLMAEKLEEKVRQRTGELLQMNDELIRQKEFVEIILDSSLVLVIVFDLQKRVITFNKKCEQVFNLPKQEIIGKTFEEVFPGIELSGSYLNLELAIKGETLHIPKYQSVVNHNYYESFFVPLKDMEGNVYAVLLTAHDITEVVNSTEKLEAAYRTLEEQNKALERSNQELESFSYVASHDLQEPLRKIQTFTELLHRNIDNYQESEKYFEKISSSAKRMSALIRDVLNYSKLARQDEAMETVDLDKIAREVILDFELLVSETQAVITRDDLPAIKGIPLQLHQLFTNLLSNSLKFCNENPIIEIKYRFIKPGELLKETGIVHNQAYHYLRFCDNGIGFEQQFSDKIFTIFQRLNSRHYSGTGIGLALCKKIVENHHGIIRAESSPGMGAKFHVFLPAQ